MIGRLSIRPRDKSTVVQLRRGSTTQWTETNPVLADGEPGVDTDEKRIKVGDGRTQWNDLDWAAWIPDHMFWGRD